MVVGTLSLVQKRSNQWIQWMHHAVRSGCSGIVVYGGGDIVFGTKSSNQWMQYAVRSGCSGIVIYGDGDIVFGAKRSNKWTQWTQYAVCSTQWMQWNSGIWWWGHCLWCKKVKPVDAVNTVHSGCSGIVVYGGGDIVFGAKCSNQWMQWTQYTVDTVE